MISSLDKALVALIMGGAFIINQFTGFHFGMDEGTATIIGGALSTFLVWLVPNKAPA